MPRAVRGNIEGTRLRRVSEVINTLPSNGARLRVVYVYISEKKNGYT